MQRRTRKRLAAMSGIINTLKGQLKRALALVLCLAMIVPLAMVTKLVQADDEDDNTNPVSPEDLYTREADKNTMDSYVQGSLGGFIYTERDNVDAVPPHGSEQFRHPLRRRGLGGQVRLCPVLARDRRDPAL